jgi:hypothetical protein
MKKIILALTLCLLLVIPVIVGATDWYKANTVTVGWDPSTTWVDDTPIIFLEGEYLQYTVYTKSPGDTTATAVGATVDLKHVITINPGDKKYIGIAVSFVSIDGLISDESIIAWSDDPIMCLNGNTFGVHNLKRPKNSDNLNKQ